MPLVRAAKTWDRYSFNMASGLANSFKPSLFSYGKRFEPRSISSSYFGIVRVRVFLLLVTRTITQYELFFVVLYYVILTVKLATIYMY